MIRRTFILPAAYLSALDRLHDQLKDEIVAGRIPEFAQDDLPGNMVVQVTIERASPLACSPEPHLSHRGTAA